MSRPAEGACLSHRQVDRVVGHVLWDVSAEPAATEHVAGCPHCSRRLAAAVAEERRFWAEVLPRTLPRLVNAWRRRQFLGSIWKPVLAACAACLAAVVLVSVEIRDSEHGPGDAFPGAAAPVPGVRAGPDRGGGSGPAAREEYVGTKSAAALRLFVARDGEVRPHAAGMELRPEDQVRVLPAPAGYDRLLLVWVDGEGGMQVVHPWEGEASGELPRPGEALDGSLILDEKAGMEHLVAFFSDAPVAAPEALAWLSRRAGAFDCGLFELDGVPVEVVVVRLVKEAR